MCRRAFDANQVLRIPRHCRRAYTVVSSSSLQQGPIVSVLVPLLLRVTFTAGKHLVASSPDHLLTSWKHIYTPYFFHNFEAFEFEGPGDCWFECIFLRILYPDFTLYRPFRLSLQISWPRRKRNLHHFCCIKTR